MKACAKLGLKKLYFKSKHVMNMGSSLKIAIKVSLKLILLHPRKRKTNSEEKARFKTL